MHHACKPSSVTDLAENRSEYTRWFSCGVTQSDILPTGLEVSVTPVGGPAGLAVLIVAACVQTFVRSGPG